MCLSMAAQGYQTCPGFHVIRIKDETLFVGATIKKEVVKQTEGILERLSELNHENPESTLKELIQELAKEYNVNIELDGTVIPKNLKTYEKPDTVYLFITKAA